MTVGPSVGWAHLGLSLPAMWWYWPSVDLPVVGQQLSQTSVFSTWVLAPLHQPAWTEAGQSCLHQLSRGLSQRWPGHNAVYTISPRMPPPAAIAESAAVLSHDKIKLHLQTLGEKTKPPQQVPSSWPPLPPGKPHCLVEKIPS